MYKHRCGNQPAWGSNSGCTATCAVSATPQQRYDGKCMNEGYKAAQQKKNTRKATVKSHREAAAGKGWCGGKRHTSQGEMERKGLWESACGREGVCLRCRCRGVGGEFRNFLRGYLRVFDAIWNGAPPQVHIHLKLGGTPSGSPQIWSGPWWNHRNRHIVNIGCIYRPIYHIYGSLIR